MPVVLITGMSGAGKSTVLSALARLGHATVDTDDPAWLEVVDGEPLWREPMIERLIDRSGPEPLFLLGTVANQGRFAHRFGAVVLLTALQEILLERLRTRTSNTYGRSAGQRAAVVRDIAEVEPRLRAMATHVIDTIAPLPEVVAELVRIGDSAAQKEASDLGVPTPVGPSAPTPAVQTGAEEQEPFEPEVTSQKRPEPE